MQVYGYSPWGYEGNLVRVEIDLRRGIPGMEIVGLPGGAVREARERVRIALRRAGFEFPAERILVNLSPGDLPKVGSGYDLPIALALLEASGQWRSPVPSVLAIGELGLNGDLRRVPGILAAAQSCLKEQIQAFAVPADGRAEAACVAGLPLAAGSDLGALVANLHLAPLLTGTAALPSPDRETDPAWDLRGQGQVVEALEVAAAGGHSLLLYGPPGGGKSLAARSLEQLLPSWEAEEALETTRLWSLAGLVERNRGLLGRRPFRSPHHHASAEGLLGGGCDFPQ